MSEAIEINENQPKVREPFEVDNDLKAEWCLKKIRKVKAEAHDEIEELTRQMEFYKNEIEMVEREMQSDVDFFESILRKYFEKRVGEGFTKASKTQTVYKLPSGKLILKKREPKYDTKDGSFLEWLKSNKLNDFIKVEETPEWGKFKKTLPKNEDGSYKMIEDDDGIHLVNSDGEIIPGVKVTKQDDDFIVEG